MPIKGSLTDMSIADILQMLSIGGKTGELAITNEENLAYIYLNSGKLTNVHWVNREDKLGKILVKQGYLDKESIKEVLEIQKEETDKQLGEILLELELVKKDILKKSLKKQLRDAIVEISNWNSGYFVFESNRNAEKGGIPISVKVEDILLESAAFRDQFEASSIPSRDSILKVNKEKLDEFELKEEEGKLIDIIDGEKTIEEILEMTSLDEIKVLQILSKYIKRDIINKTKYDSTTIKKAKSKLKEHKNLGIAFLRINMYDEALREFNHILEVAPENRDALFYKSIILLETGQIERSRKMIESAFKDSSRISILNNLAVIYETTGNNEKALEILESILSREPENQKVLLNKAITLIKIDKLDRALQILENLENFEEYVYFYRANILIKKSDTAAALEELEKGLENDPQFGEYYYNLALIYRAVKNEKKELEVLKKGLEVDHNSIHLIKGILDYYYRNKLFEQAMKIINRAISNEVADWEIYFKKGNILFQEGLKDKALESWEAALDLNPENKTIRKNIEMVTGNEQKRKT